MKLNFVYVFLMCLSGQQFFSDLYASRSSLVYLSGMTNQIYMTKVGPWKILKAIDLMTILYTDNPADEC